MGTAKEPIVLIHGAAGASWRDFQPLVPHLEPHREIVVLRNAGHYEAEPLPPEADLSTEAFVDRVEGELDRRGLERPDVVGDSTGGLFALELARRNRARAVVAISPAGMWTPEEGRVLERDLRRAYHLARTLLPLAVSVSKIPGGRYMLFAPMLGTRGAKLDREDAHHVLRALVDSSLTLDIIEANKDDGGALRVMERPDEIRCPVLFLWGERDRLMPVEQGQRWTEAIPDAELRELVGIGHHPQFDEPEEVAKLVLDFFSRTTKEAAPDSGRGT